MKTNRIRRHGASRPVKPQEKSRPEKNVTVIFKDENRHEVCCVDFPAQTFDAIQRCRRKLGLSFDKFFKLAMLNKIQSTLGAQNSIAGGVQ